MKYLVSSKEFGKLLTEKSDSEYRKLRENFDKFLDKPLRLGYFIPCDENDNPLEEYKRTEREIIADNLRQCRIISKEESKYLEAKQRVLFDWFNFIGGGEIEHAVSPNYISFGVDKIKLENGFGYETLVYTIEDLVELKLTLTETAIQELQKIQE